MCDFEALAGCCCLLGLAAAAELECAAAAELDWLWSSSDEIEISLAGELLCENIYWCVDACGFVY